MNSLPTGMYQPGSSFLHRLSGLTKLLCLFVLLAAVIKTRSIPGYVLLLALAAAAALLSRCPLSSALGSVWRLRWFSCWCCL